MSAVLLKFDWCDFQRQHKQTINQDKERILKMVQTKQKRWFGCFYLKLYSRISMQTLKSTQNTIMKLMLIKFRKQHLKCQIKVQMQFRKFNSLMLTEILWSKQHKNQIDNMHMEIEMDIPIDPFLQREFPKLRLVPWLMHRSMWKPSTTLVEYILYRSELFVVLVLLRKAHYTADNMWFTF